MACAAAPDDAPLSLARVPKRFALNFLALDGVRGVLHELRSRVCVDCGVSESNKIHRWDPISSSLGCTAVVGLLLLRRLLVGETVTGGTH